MVIQSAGTMSDGLENYTSYIEEIFGNKVKTQGFMTWGEAQDILE
jgi:hypothetical protein